jgi:membrane associated rhomboid family serine protease
VVLPEQVDLSRRHAQVAGRLGSVPQAWAIGWTQLGVRFEEGVLDDGHEFRALKKNKRFVHEDPIVDGTSSASARSRIFTALCTSNGMRMRRPVRPPLPIATFALAVAILAVFGIELAGDGQALCEAYGLIPAAPSFVAALLSLFLHDPANVWHIGGNLVFLVVFGSIVERALGHMRFLGPYAASGVAGAALHVLIDPSATTPLVGASGAVFGVMAVAAVLRPRLLGFVVAFGLAEVFHVLAGGDGNASAACHIGGLVAGALLAALAVRRAGAAPRLA